MGQDDTNTCFLWEHSELRVLFITASSYDCTVSFRGILFKLLNCCMLLVDMYHLTPVSESSYPIDGVRWSVQQPILKWNFHPFITVLENWFLSKLLELALKPLKLHGIINIGNSLMRCCEKNLCTRAVGRGPNTWMTYRAPFQKGPRSLTEGLIFWLCEIFINLIRFINFLFRI